MTKLQKTILLDTPHRFVVDFHPEDHETETMELVMDPGFSYIHVLYRNVHNLSKEDIEEIIQNEIFYYDPLIFQGRWNGYFVMSFFK